MPPFQYRTVQDPYVGSITNLMGAGPAAEAQSIRDVGAIRAQESLQKGDIRSNLIGGLGETASQGYAAYRDAKADDMWAKFLAEHAPLDFDRMTLSDSPTPWAAGGVQMPDPEPPPPLTPQTTTSEIYRGSDPAITIEGDATAEGPTITHALPYEGAPQPTLAAGTPGVLGNMTGVAPGASRTPQPDRGQFFSHITNHGLHDVVSLRARASREGMSEDQIARKIAESSAHNQSALSFIQQNSALQMSDQAMRREGLLATILGQNPQPTPELMATMVAALGPEEGARIFEVYTSSLQALQDLQQNNFENAGASLRAIMAGVRLTNNPQAQATLLENIAGTFEAAGVPLPPEWQGLTVDQWDAVIDQAFPLEDSATTQWGYEQQLQDDLANGVPGAKAAWDNYLQRRTEVTRATQRPTAPANSGRALTRTLEYNQELSVLTNLYNESKATEDFLVFPDGVEVTEEEYRRRADAIWNDLQTDLETIGESAGGISAMNPTHPLEEGDAQREALALSETRQERAGIQHRMETIQRDIAEVEASDYPEQFSNVSKLNQLKEQLATERARLQELGVPESERPNPEEFNLSGFNLPSRGVNAPR
jgi:hypothetical protein